MSEVELILEDVERAIEETCAEVGSWENAECRIGALIALGNLTKRLRQHVFDVAMNPPGKMPVIATMELVTQAVRNIHAEMKRAGYWSDEAMDVVKAMAEWLPVEITRLYRQVGNENHQEGDNRV